MAYITYCACDKCGESMIVYQDATVSLDRMKKIARREKWTVGKNGWICPDCQKAEAKKQEVHCIGRHGNLPVLPTLEESP